MWISETDGVVTADVGASNNGGGISVESSDGISGGGGSDGVRWLGMIWSNQVLLKALLYILGLFRRYFAFLLPECGTVLTFVPQLVHHVIVFGYLVSHLTQ